MMGPFVSRYVAHSLRELTFGRYHLLRSHKLGGFTNVHRLLMCYCPSGHRKIGHCRVLSVHGIISLVVFTCVYKKNRFIMFYFIFICYFMCSTCYFTNELLETSILSICKKSVGNRLVSTTAIKVILMLKNIYVTFCMNNLA